MLLGGTSAIAISGALATEANDNITDESGNLLVTET